MNADSPPKSHTRSSGRNVSTNATLTNIGRIRRVQAPIFQSPPSATPPLNPHRFFDTVIDIRHFAPPTPYRAGIFTMNVSIVDLSTVYQGENAAMAFQHTLERAKDADRLGFSRFWVAEHHGVGHIQAATTPEVMIPYIAAQTQRIRVGSGAVLLNHYSPYKVAETFSALDAMTPGRIDLGLGRANGFPAADLALQHDRKQQQRYVDDHAQRIAEIIAFLHRGFPNDHPFARIELARAPDSTPELWLLGSSPRSAQIAAKFGLPYCFAAFINPSAAVHAFQVYYQNFQPSALGIANGKPKGMIGVNVSCAETDQDAARLRASPIAFYQRLGQQNFQAPPPADQAIDYLGYVPDPTPHTLEAGNWPKQLSGSPQTIANYFEQIREQTHVDEIIVQNLLGSAQDALRSHQLIAEGVFAE